MVVDWLPWSHTFGSNHNFDMVLTNGGSLYIDDGNPTPPGVPKTVRNLREIAPTIYFNVPKGYEALLPHFRADETLRKNFFSRLKVLFYAGAGLNQITWDELDAAGGRDHRRAHHLPVLARLDRDLAAGARLHLGFRPRPAISACRRRASNSSWCRTKASWKRACAARTSRPAIGGSRS